MRAFGVVKRKLVDLVKAAVVGAQKNRSSALKRYTNQHVEHDESQAGRLV